jgi:hypothetical protein
MSLSTVTLGPTVVEINQGPTGPPNVLTIGTVTGGASASATITGSSPSQALNLVLPKGDTGNAATIAVGTTTTGNAGTNASVANAGTSGAAIFNFTIPRGDVGAAGPSNVLSIGTVSSGATPSVNITGTSPTQTLNFVLQKGDKGDTGDTGPQGPTGQSATSYPYKAKTGNTSGDPGVSHLIWNNATQINSTQINLNHIASDGNDYDAFLALLKTDDIIILQTNDNSNNFQKWRVSATPTIIPNSYIQIPVVLIGSGGTGTSNFANNEALLFLFITTGAVGPAGPSNTLSIGTVDAGGIGVASATITGTSPNQTLNLVIPTGQTGATGPTGAAATISVGSVATGDAGTNASVTNSGTSGAAIFDFSIPRGPQPSLVITDNSNTSITLSDSDNNSVVRCTASSAVTVTVPSTLAAGFSCMIIQAGTGRVTLQAGAGTTINSFGSLLSTAGQHAPASLIRVASGMYNLSGNLV